VPRPRSSSHWIKVITETLVLCHEIARQRLLHMRSEHYLLCHAGDPAFMQTNAVRPPLRNPGRTRIHG
jgi:hypothetical protein